MNRREILASLGSASIVLGGGCLGGSGDGTPGRKTDTPTTTSPPRDHGTTTEHPPTTADPPDWNPGPQGPFETIPVGSRDGVPFPENNRAHAVKIWNHADEGRTITVTIDEGGAVLLERSLRFPADGLLEIVLNEPGTYTLELGVGGSTVDSVSLDRSRFDCNASSTQVIVTESGSVHARTITTLLACPGPTVASRSFSRGSGTCGMMDEATVTFADETVTVDGQIRTPNPCYDLRLARAELVGAEAVSNGGDTVLVVTVATAGQRDDVCTSCVGSVPYEVDIGFERAYPSHVRVVHRSPEGERTVTTVKR
ncbi:MAG: hypothetical protein ABEI31_10735 [Halodesulfurarchaeum sp.]